MFGGVMIESLSRVFGGGGLGFVFLSGKNMECLVIKFLRMRGVVFKIG